MVPAATHSGAPDTLAQARAALREVVPRLVTLVRSAPNPNSASVGTWTVGEVAAHLSHVFRADTDYFGSSGQGFMVNFRVASLDRVLERLRAAGAEVDEETQEQDGIGRFGWAVDPEGNRFELWEPAEGM